jgi:Na+/melibiose symporter-like transporter
MLNDLTSACWFTYLLIFLTDIGLSPQEAATVMLSGQVADAIATVIVGQLIDTFGHFKIWHGGGSLLVAVSFSSVFGGCMACALLGNNYAIAHTIGYSAFAAIFNVGWAATQVSHMSLVNCITSNQTSQVSLNSCRNAFTMVANLGLYVIAYVVFRILPSKQVCDVETQYKWIAGIAIAVGCCFVVVFHIGVTEPRLAHHKQDADECSGPRPSFKIWFKKVLYYQVAAVYMLTRLTTNVSQALLPFYLIDDLRMEESSKAVVPALIYSCSFLASIVLQELRWTSFKLKAVFAMGAGLWVASGAIFLLLPQSSHGIAYILAVLVGIGNAFMLVTATSMEGLLVSTNLSGCGFVYGSLSFLDKLACGIALYWIEGMNVQTRFCPTEIGVGNNLLTFPPICHCSLIRVALALVPSGCALLAWIITTTITFEEIPEIDSSLQAPLLVEEGALSPSRSSPRSIRAPRKSAENHGITLDLEATPVEAEQEPEIESAEPAVLLPYDEEQSLWQMLGHAMVGRWGSIRPARFSILQ